VTDQQLNDLEIVVAQHRIVKRSLAPPRNSVRVDAVLEDELDSVVVVPVGFA